MRFDLEWLVKASRRSTCACTTSVASWPNPEIAVSRRITGPDQRRTSGPDPLRSDHLLQNGQSAEFNFADWNAISGRWRLRPIEHIQPSAHACARHSNGASTEILVIRGVYYFAACEARANVGCPALKRTTWCSSSRYSALGRYRQFRLIDSHRQRRAWTRTE